MATKQARAGSRTGQGNRPGKGGGTAARNRPAGNGGKAIANGKVSANGKTTANGKDLEKLPGASVSRQAPRSVPQNRKARDRARARELALQQTEAEPTAEAKPPRWVQFSSLALAILGLNVGG